MKNELREKLFRSVVQKIREVIIERLGDIRVTGQSNTLKLTKEDLTGLSQEETELVEEEPLDTLQALNASFEADGTIEAMSGPTPGDLYIEYFPVDNMEAGLTIRGRSYKRKGSSFLP